ncbi:MAG: glutamate racemase [Gammaproteobacteria bacterium]
MDNPPTFERGVPAPIGVFDSGVGGLTVLRALARTLPDERFLYLGDTARLPYGTKTADTVVRYSVQCAGLLVQRGVKALVVACNTASSVALPALAAAYPGIPVLGVVEPGADAAIRATGKGHVAVIATEGTVRGGAYVRALQSLDPAVRVTQVPCALFVALAEEGWTDGVVVEAVARRYLEAVFAGSDAPDTLLLGCTHFPVLAPALRRVVGDDVMLVDSAATTALAMARLLGKSVPVESAMPGPAAVADSGTRFHFLATDGLERFARVGATFLGTPIAPQALELVDL